MIEAAGVLFLADDKVLLVKRGAGGDEPGTWALPGGKLEAGETAAQAARRECREELRIDPDGKLNLFARRQDGKVDYTTFLRRCKKEFEPRLNDEHTEFIWADQGNLPVPLHPGVVTVLQKLTMDELGIARAMVAGELTSPQHYGNVWLFDMRITGTGTSFRSAHDEFVYRPPDNYLSDEFLARCNGLPVIMQHPPGNTLNTKEFRDRVVGTIFLPYLKGDEVWGIAKIYDEDAANMMADEQLSTSPAVFFHHPEVNVKKPLDDGSTLLIEGKPSLLDHLAVCEQGVWDKGGEPTGVSSTTTNGATTMTEEEMKAKADADAKFEKEEQEKADKAKKDADGGDKMDKLMAMCDAMSKRMDAFEGKSKKDADTSEPEGKGGEPGGEEEGKPVAAAADKAKADKAKKDADEEKKVDEDEKKVEEARADAAALRARIDELERKIPRAIDDGEYASLADAQARADGVLAKFGSAAPRPLNAERLLGYRRRLATQLKTHSTTWKDIDLYKVGEEVLNVAEPQIYADAAAAAMNPSDLAEGELREQFTTDRTGRRISTFVGRPNAWMGMFKAPKRRVTHINKSGV